MSGHAWVTLATNDSYSLGALVLAHSLRRVSSAHPAVILITPGVTDIMRERLQTVFAEVITVDVLDSGDAAHLALLARPELGITFTKLHCWTLTQYDKCVFLDADTLVLQNCDELFDREQLSAAPDIGWPDCFNSGVFVYRPSLETFQALLEHARLRGSFDGGDQGLLNTFFSDWAHGDIAKHLPFLYNISSVAFYSYLPALKQFGGNAKIIHFIGNAKPWLQIFNWETRSVSSDAAHLQPALQLWWDIFCSNVHSSLDASMPKEDSLFTEAPIETWSTGEEEPHALEGRRYTTPVNSESPFPWHRPSQRMTNKDQANVLKSLSEFHDPWENYKGQADNVKNNENTFNSFEDDVTDNISTQVTSQTTPRSNITHDQLYDNCDQHDYHENEQKRYLSNDDTNFHETSHQHKHTLPQSTHLENELLNLQNQHTHTYNIQFENFSNDNDNDNQWNYSYHTNSDSKTFENRSEHSFTVVSQQKQHTLAYSIDNLPNTNKIVSESEKVDDDAKTVIDSQTVLEETPQEVYIEEVKPRHPYDNYYLLHLPIIDKYGCKRCSHEAPLPPTPPRSPSPPPPEAVAQQIEDEQHYHEQAGIAGTFSQITLGAVGQQAAVDESQRRQGWEAGNIDYLGADSFTNIWAKISETLSQPSVAAQTEETSPPKEILSQSAPASEAPAPLTELTPSESVLPTKTSPIREDPAPEPATEDIPGEISQIVEPSASPAAETTERVSADTISEPAVILPDSNPESQSSKEQALAEKPDGSVGIPPASSAVLPIGSETKSPESKYEREEDPKNNKQQQIETPEIRKITPKEKLVFLKPTPEQESILTPDSELEDAASIAQSIIASELIISSPIITSATPPIALAEAASVAPQYQKDLCVDTTVPETPPVRELVSLAQIGIVPGKTEKDDIVQPDTEDNVHKTITSDLKRLPEPDQTVKKCEDFHQTIQMVNEPEPSIKPELPVLINTKVTDDLPKLSTVIPAANQEETESTPLPLVDEKTEVLKTLHKEAARVDTTLEKATKNDIEKKEDTQTEKSIGETEVEVTKTDDVKIDDSKHKKLPKKLPSKPPPPKGTNQTSSAPNVSEKQETKSSEAPVPPPRKKEKKNKK